MSESADPQKWLLVSDAGVDGGKKYRDRVEDASTGFKTPQDAIVVVVRENDATWKKFYPSGETGKRGHPSGADLPRLKPPGAAQDKGTRLRET